MTKDKQINKIRFSLKKKKSIPKQVFKHEKNYTLRYCRQLKKCFYKLKQDAGSDKCWFKSKT